MALELPLDALQRWFQAVVVSPGDCEEALDSVEARGTVPGDRIGEVLRPSQTLASAERIAIYHRMYPLRMADALASDYPALQHFLGDQAFHELVEAYVREFPSRSYTLNRLGDHLPEYLTTATGVRRRGFCHELARLELAVTQAFDAPEVPPLTPEQVGAVAPEIWETARLTPVAAFRLLAFRYPVNAYLQSVRDDDHDHPKPRLSATFVAVYRRDYSVQRMELSRSAHDLLHDLVEGAALGAAVTAALRRGVRRAPREEELFRWFRDWVAAGLFRELEASGDSGAIPPPEPRVAARARFLAK